MEHQTRRSFTGHHNLLPARSHSGDSTVFLPYVKLRSDNLFSWTFGRGTVIWRIWPAVALHIIFAAAVVYWSFETDYSLAIPPVLLTVLGVVLGFVISYRAMSGYDRYWMGRTCWSDVIRTARAMGRLIWFHVPPNMTPMTAEEIESGEWNRDRAELLKVMKEKRMALDLVEAFAVALKHHLRGEMGLYYEDLYHLVQPLHEHHHYGKHHESVQTPKAETIRVRSSKSQPNLRKPISQPQFSQPSILTSSPPPTPPHPVIPPINAYGTFNPSTSSLSLPQPQPNGKRKSRGRAQSSVSETTVDGVCNSDGEQHHLIQPSELAQETTVMGEVSGDLIPFQSFFSSLGEAWRGLFRRGPELPLTDQDSEEQGKWNSFSRSTSERRARRQMMAKSRPRLARGGENVPLDVLRVLAEWVSVLERRGTVPGGGIGGMHGCITSFEDSLSGLERILTTPLPFVYSVHIRHTVWIYLFFLPFQLLEQFGWSTIPGVGIAAFIYLGFLAAGEEIEQPFGYDENDLDLDLYTGVIIHEDMEELKKTQCLNAYHSHKSTRLARSIAVTVEENSRDGRANGDGEWDEDGDGVGDGYGIGDDYFGIAE